MLWGYPNFPTDSPLHTLVHAVSLLLMVLRLRSSTLTTQPDRLIGSSHTKGLLPELGCLFHLFLNTKDTDHLISTVRRGKPRGSELDLWSSACTGAKVQFQLPAFILLQYPLVRDLLYIAKSSWMGPKTGGPVSVHTLHCTHIKSHLTLKKKRVGPCGWWWWMTVHQHTREGNLLKTYKNVLPQKPIVVADQGMRGDLFQE